MEKKEQEMTDLQPELQKRRDVVFLNVIKSGICGLLVLFIRI